MSLPSVNKTESSEYKIKKNVVGKIRELTESFPEKNSAMIPAMHLIQDEFGWLPDQAIRELADILKVAPNKIYGVASFYSMFNLKPVGKYHIQVCRNVSCQLMGAKNVIEHLSKKLNIQPGETTEDNKYSISQVECLGSCGTAPVMMINDKYYENLTEQKVDEIIKTLQ
ncbi:NADH-quinone oxidoreductase subunit NuoE [candidate division KSB1 bacterium]|nr:NADH-quinone oxidoreductase subunit NuoE [candidate division KSB1 bacterium]